jgi:LAS superfamily LD-carboxypeptidase LdcB
MNPDACSPPTAIPGRSKHEQGLAIDFSHNGRAIQTRSSPAFQWLAANAGSYGFRNLPSEPWHWSTDGT